MLTAVLDCCWGNRANMSPYTTPPPAPAGPRTAGRPRPRSSGLCDLAPQRRPPGRCVGQQHGPAGATRAPTCRPPAPRAAWRGGEGPCRAPVVGQEAPEAERCAHERPHERPGARLGPACDPRHAHGVPGRRGPTGRGRPTKAASTASPTTGDHSTPQPPRRHHVTGGGGGAQGPTPPPRRPPLGRPMHRRQPGAAEPTQRPGRGGVTSYPYRAAGTPDAASIWQRTRNGRANAPQRCRCAEEARGIGATGGKSAPPRPPQLWVVTKICKGLAGLAAAAPRPPQARSRSVRVARLHTPGGPPERMAAPGPLDLCCGSPLLPRDRSKRGQQRPPPPSRAVACCGGVPLQLSGKRAPPHRAATPHRRRQHPTTFGTKGPFFADIA